MPDDSPEKLLNPSEVAAMFSVDVKTVGRWADRGKVDYIRTPGGQRMYPAAQFGEFLKPMRGKRQAKP